MVLLFESYGIALNHMVLLFESYGIALNNMALLFESFGIALNHMVLLSIIWFCFQSYGIDFDTDIQVNAILKQ